MFIQFKRVFNFKEMVNRPVTQIEPTPGKLRVLKKIVGSCPLYLHFLCTLKQGISDLEMAMFLQKIRSELSSEVFLRAPIQWPICSD